MTQRCRRGAAAHEGAARAGRAALEFLNRSDADLVTFLERLVATPSQNPPGDERAVAAVVAEELLRVGVDDIRSVGPDDRRINLIVDVPGVAGSPTLMLCGHLDTKPSGNPSAWSTDPLHPSWVGDDLYGLGAADMKGAVSAMVYAAAAYSRTPSAANLRLVFTADEESGSVNGAAWLASGGLLAADAAIIGEPSGIGSDWDAIRLVSRGVCLFRIRVSGTRMHSGLSDQLPSVNASVLMSRLLCRLDERRDVVFASSPHPLGSRPTANVGLEVRAGGGPGILPPAAEFLCDVRTLPSQSRTDIEERIRQFLADVGREEPRLDASFAVELWHQGCEVDADHAVVRAATSAAETVLGRRPAFAAFPGGTDAPYLQLAAGIPTIPAFGPGLLSRAHAPDERVSITAVRDAARMYALTAARFADLWQGDE